MLNAGNAALAAAIESPTREVVADLRINWSRDNSFVGPYEELSNVVQSVTVDSDYTGALPQEATLVEGFAASKLDITLGGNFGDGKNVVDLLTPFRSDSPFYSQSFIGCPVKLSLTVREADGTITENPQFYGQLTELRVDHTTRTVTVTAIDNAESVRAPISFPGYGMEFYSQLSSVSADQFDAYGSKINSQWIIDYILRKNGIYSSPPATDYARVSITAHGSPTCELAISQGVGWTGYAGGEIPSYINSRYGKMLAVPQARLINDGLIMNSVSSSGITPTPLVFSNGNAITCQFQVLASQDMGLLELIGSERAWVISVQEIAAVDESAYIIFGITTLGRPYVHIYENFTQVLYHEFDQVPAGAAAWRNVAMAVRFNGASSQVLCQIDNGSVSSSTVSITGMDDISSFGHDSRFIYFGDVPTSNIQIAQPPYANYALGWYDYDATFLDTDIDPGLNFLSGIPTIQGEDSWELLKEVVDAEFGTHGFNEFGKYYFVNRDNAYRGSLVVDKEFDPSEIVNGISFTQRADSVRNVISTSTEPLVLMDRVSDTRVVYELQPDDIDRLVMRPGYNEFVVKFQSPGFLDYRYGSTWVFTVDEAGWNLNETNDSTLSMCIPVNVNTTTVVNFTDTTCWVYPELPDGMTYRVLFYNPNEFDIVFKKPSNGSPAFRIFGKSYGNLAETTSLISSASSIALHGERVLRLPGGRFRQLQSSMQPVAIELLSDLRNPVPIMEDLFVEHDDPRVQLRDTITINDARIGETVIASVISITRSYIRGRGLNCVYKVKLTGFPGRWILGHPVYGVLGSTTIVG